MSAQEGLAWIVLIVLLLAVLFTEAEVVFRGRPVRNPFARAGVTLLAWACMAIVFQLAGAVLLWAGNAMGMPIIRMLGLLN